MKATGNVRRTKEQMAKEVEELRAQLFASQQRAEEEERLAREMERELETAEERARREGKRVDEMRARLEELEQRLHEAMGQLAAKRLAEVEPPEQAKGCDLSFMPEREGVARVHYPGLRSHPGHALAARQQRGFGAMLALELDGGVEAVRAFLDGLECFTLAESLGGVESLVAHPATMTHAAMAPGVRAAAGISDGLLRLSVGIEALEDLQADLDAALARTVRRREAAERAGA